MSSSVCFLDRQELVVDVILVFSSDFVVSFAIPEDVLSSGSGSFAVGMRTNVGVDEFSSA